jgi:ribosome modulation factor
MCAKRLDAAEKKSNGPSPGEYSDFRAEMREIAREQKELSNRRLALGKRMKAAGMDDVALSIVTKLAKLDDDVAQSTARNIVKFATWEELEGWSQTDLFGTPIAQATETDKVKWNREKAYDAGFTAGKRADDIKTCPFDAGSDFGEKWITGWHAGQATNAPAKAEGVTVARGGKGKRGAAKAAAALADAPPSALN